VTIVPNVLGTFGEIVVGCHGDGVTVRLLHTGHGFCMQ
jgi:hypothetical protein